MRNPSVLFVAAAILSSSMVSSTILSAQDREVRFARYPHSSSDGKLAFSYHGDIWVADIDGANPRRLTAHVANDRHARFSPDGTHIAFTSDRMGNDDLYVVPVDGGEPRQVTFHSTGDTMLYWTPDGKRLLFATRRGPNPWGSPLHTVSAEGDLPVPLKMDKGAYGMIRQDGKKIAFNRNGTRYWRKGYRGNSNTDVCVQDVDGGDIDQLTDRNLKKFRKHTQDAYPMWGADGLIYFLSEKSGTFNIWRIPPGGGEAKQVTKHDKDGVQLPSISPDGKVITYECDFRIFKLTVADGRSQEIVIRMGFDPKSNRTEFLKSDSSADGFSPSPDGSYVALDFHGEIFVVPTEPGVGEKQQITSSAFRDRSAIWSPDGKRLAFVSDESGDEEIWISDVAAGTRRKVTTHASLKRRPVWSPDSKQLAYVAANRLFLVDAASGKNTELNHNTEGGFSLDGFSADNKWLVYSRSDENVDSEVYLFEIATRKETNVTQNPFSESNGIVTRDGKHVLFVSSRDGGDRHLFRVALQALTEDPDDPLVRERRKTEKKSKGKDRRRGRDKAATEEPVVPAGAITIDTDGIADRAVQLTRGESIRSPILSRDGKTVYFTSSDDKGPGLFSIPVDDAAAKRKRVADGSFSGLTLTADGKSFFFGQRSSTRGRGRRGGRSAGGGAIYKMSASGGKKAKIDFAVTVAVDKHKEWRQIFNESWRTMKYRFYDENMHGANWDEVHATYEKLLPFVGENQDLYDLCNEMIGELNASHTGVRGPSGRSSPESYQTRLLGFEMQPSGGHLKITHVHRKGPADQEWLDLAVGDVVVSIDGKKVNPEVNYWRILNHALNEYVTVEVAKAPGQKPIAQRIKTTTSLRNVQYEEWVEKSRAFVEKISGGRVAYLHIRSMNQSSLKRFENEINRFWNAKSLIVDIRYNGGGNIDQQLLDILERRPYEYWNGRWSGRARGRRPHQAIAGPKVMLINWRSASDSEVTPQGFRDLGLGRIVGNPTNGSVIATGSHRLINGASIRVPGYLVATYDPTKPHNYGINLENFGVPPDVWVENTPADELRGHDRELEAAVKEALRMLESGTWQYRNGK